jgi:hypothetical protein
MQAQIVGNVPDDRDRLEHTQPVGHHISIFVRCLIERVGDQWQGFSLEYGLAVQGASRADVQTRLERVILSYVHDALVGEDRKHANELLSRRATARVYLRYYVARILSLILRGKDDSSKAYREPLALEPRLCSP